MRNNYSVSNILIVLSILATLAVTLNRELYVFGMNTFFLDNWEYHIYALQFFSSQFLHGWVMHLVFNAVFIYYFGNILEWLIWKNKFLFFFIFTALINGLAITYTSPLWNTVWISGFAMALLSYYALEMRSRADFQESKWALTAIVLNVAIWFAPGISLIGHASWAFAWILYYYINKNFFTPKFIGKQKSYQDMLGSKWVVPEMNEKL